MKRYLLLSLLSSAALAEVPPPGTARKGPIVVTPEGMSTHEYDLSAFKVIPREDSRKVQKKIDALRARIKELEAQLANKPIPVAQESEIVERVVERVVENQNRQRFAVYGGVMPDGIHVEEGDLSRTGRIHEQGSAVGLGYGYRFTDHWSANAFGALTTRSTNITAGFLGLGYDF